MLIMGEPVRGKLDARPPSFSRQALASGAAPSCAPTRVEEDSATYFFQEPLHVCPPSLKYHTLKTAIHDRDELDLIYFVRSSPAIVLRGTIPVVPLHILHWVIIDNCHG